MVHKRKMQMRALRGDHPPQVTVVASCRSPRWLSQAPPEAGIRGVSGPGSCSAGWNLGENDPRGMLRIHIDGVLRDPPSTVRVERLAGIRIHVEAREVVA